MSPSQVASICAWVVSCRGYRRNAHVEERHHYYLGLKERCDASSGTPPRVSLRQARRPWGPQYCSVHDGLVLLDVKMFLDPLASATGAAAPVAGRAHHLPGPDVYHPHREYVLRSSALLKPDTEELHSPLSPLGLLKEPCQHTCLKHPYRTLELKPSAGKTLLSEYHVLKGMQECYPP